MAQPGHAEAVAMCPLFGEERLGRARSDSCWCTGLAVAPRGGTDGGRTVQMSAVGQGSRMQTGGTSEVTSPFCRRVSRSRAAGANTDGMDVCLLSRMGEMTMF
jgi:hypothetical protein